MAQISLVIKSDVSWVLKSWEEPGKEKVEGVEEDVWSWDDMRDDRRSE